MNLGFLSRRPKFLRFAFIILFVLSCSSFDFCGEEFNKAAWQFNKAVWEGDLATVENLLKDNHDLIASKTADGWMPLHIAAQYGYKEIVELLLYEKGRFKCKGQRRQDAIALGSH
jgi:hypothetical protein